MFFSVLLFSRKVLVLKDPRRPINKSLSLCSNLKSWQHHCFFMRGLYKTVNGGDMSLLFSFLSSLPSPPFISHSYLPILFLQSLTPVRGIWGALWAPQWVWGRARPTNALWCILSWKSCLWWHEINNQPIICDVRTAWNSELTLYANWLNWLNLGCATITWHPLVKSWDRPPPTNTTLFTILLRPCKNIEWKSYRT